jgi:hypothetical protein
MFFVLFCRNFVVRRIGGGRFDTDGFLLVVLVEAFTLRLLCAIGCQILEFLRTPAAEHRDEIPAAGRGNDRDADDVHKQGTGNPSKQDANTVGICRVTDGNVAKEDGKENHPEDVGRLCIDVALKEQESTQTNK